ncbi:S9 family peptidase [Sulfobacillus sp. hq2]|uniref:S9 family peptidase n=1 Tax=Sulfobacillus TaxID=28033 RepID=UPI001FA879C6|nr:S9 family peptidase [Sulfobacillus sp. hq2]
MKTQPYGSWSSPISTAMLTKDTIHLDQLTHTPSAIYWVESRPSDQGRNVIVGRRDDGTIEDRTPAPFNARTRAHEYGGRCYTVHEDTIFFTNFSDQRIYRLNPGQAPIPITAEGAMRYADLVFDALHNRLLCIREDHRQSDIQAETSIVSVDPNGDLYGTVLVHGNDFYADPRISPDGATLAWVTWNHPQMPWDGTQLWTATINAQGHLQNPRQITGSSSESVMQPVWSPDGHLTWISDREGFWNLYRWENERIRAIYPMAAEFARPAWVFGLANYVYKNADTIVATYFHHGTWHIGLLNIPAQHLDEIVTPYTFFTHPVLDHDSIFVIAGSWTQPEALVELPLTRGVPTLIKSSQMLPIDSQDISVPQLLEFPTEQGQSSYMTFYPPTNHNVIAPEGERPPLIVISHGGPTSASNPLFQIGIQYWTTRGFAVADVNYGGSTGYGRAYRERLMGQWGIVDVDDCTNAAIFLAQHGLVDPNRMVIRGGSAGGFTTLACLTFKKVFKAGASYYGVSDIGALARETHKFESRYMDNLVGPWPEAKSVYIERSPLYHAENITAPIIFFQGLDDKIVPPNQAEMMVNKMKSNHIPVAYLAFAGEGHGFRQAENIQRATEAELYFYSRILGFDLPTPVEPVEIIS